MAHRIAGDQQLSGLLATLYTTYSALVLDVVTRTLRPEDAQQAEDIAQDVWLAAWQHLLSGGTIDDPLPPLFMFIRRSVADFYGAAGTEQIREQVAA